MSDENVELVRRAYEVLTPREFSRVPEFFAPDIQIDLKEYNTCAEGPRSCRHLGVAMSRENVEFVKASYEAWNAGNMDAYRDLYDPNAVESS